MPRPVVCLRRHRKAGRAGGAAWSRRILPCLPGVLLVGLLAVALWTVVALTTPAADPRTSGPITCGCVHSRSGPCHLPGYGARKYMARVDAAATGGRARATVAARTSSEWR